MKVTFGALLAKSRKCLWSHCFSTITRSFRVAQCGRKRIRFLRFTPPGRLMRRPVLECRPIGARRVVGVLTESTGAVAMVVVGVVLSLSGCDDTAKWFAKPLEPASTTTRAIPIPRSAMPGSIAPLPRTIWSTPMARVRTMRRRGVGQCGRGRVTSGRCRALRRRRRAGNERVRHRRSTGTSDCRELRNRCVWIAQPRADLQCRSPAGHLSI